MKILKSCLNKLVCVVFIVCIVSSCVDVNDKNNTQMSILCYFVADNDLDEYSNEVLNSILRGLKRCEIGAEVFLYYDGQLKSPVLYHCLKYDDNNYGAKIVKEYDEMNSLSPNNMLNILNEMKKLSHGDRYGLIFYSHANGWLPSELLEKTKSIGLDFNQSMDLIDFKNVLSNIAPLEFLLLDACYMSGVETLYSLRNVCNYIIASPSEVYAIGFPYEDIMSLLFTNKLEHYKIAAQKYYENFTLIDDTALIFPSATIALVDCRKMSNIASLFSKLTQLDTIPYNSIQSYDGRERSFYYDFSDYVKHSYKNDTIKKELLDLVDKTVIYNAYTPQIISNVNNKTEIINVQNSCGINIYNHIDGYSYLDSMYRLTEWYNDTRCK